MRAARTPLQRLLRYGSVYTGAILIQSASAALVLPFVTRALGPADYGRVAIAFTVFSLGLSVVCLNIVAGLTRIYYDEAAKGESLRIARQLVVSNALVSIVGTALLAATVPAWAGAITPGHTEIAYLGVALCLPVAIISGPLALLRVQERPGRYVFLSLAASVGSQVGGLSFLVLGNKSPAAYLSGYLAVSSVVAVLSIALVGATTVGPATRNVVRRAVKIGLPAVPHVIAIFALALADRIVLQALSNETSVGRYQVAYVIGGLAITLVAALQSAWIPLTYSTPEADRWPVLADLTRTVVRLSALVAIVLGAISPLVLSILAPPDFHREELIPVTCLVAATAIPWAVYLPAVQILVWEERTASLAWAAPAALAVNLALVVALFPLLGLAGVALATLLAGAVLAFLFRRVTRGQARVPWDNRDLVRVALLSAPVIAADIALPTDSPFGWIVRSVIVGAAALQIWHLVRTRQRAGPDTSSQLST